MNPEFLTIPIVDDTLCQVRRLDDQNYEQRYRYSIIIKADDRELDSPYTSISCTNSFF